MRLLEVKVGKLEAEVVALSFKASERLSREPAYELELMCRVPDLDLEGLLGEEVLVSIEQGEAKGEAQQRHFHAYVFAAQDTGQLDDQYTYKLQLRSWLSFLEANSNCRIFQDLTVPQIVEKVFTGHYRADYRLELQEQYTPREYCVQFRESDLNFVKRLLEDEGLYFHVEHEAGRHELVISDTQRFEEQEGRYAKLRFLPDGEEHRAISGREGVQKLQRTRKVYANHVVLRDFDYLVPNKALQVDAQTRQNDVGAEAGVQGVQLEHYDYAAGYQDTQRGEWLARLRLQALQAQAQLLQGRANAQGMQVGRAFTLSGHPDESCNRRFTVVSTELAWVQDGPNSSSQGRNFECSYLALNDEQPFRPLRLAHARLPMH
ncbi:MAG TPA: type VI secretion system tip protein VgrG [Burkholderiaceae bacterium]|jgi:type VI secretion system secreted protein VgrG